MSQDEIDTRSTTRVVERALDGGRLSEVTSAVADLDADRITGVLERLNRTDRAVLYRLLPKGRALEVFERLDPSLQRDLVVGLQDDQVAAIFADLEPDDRVELLDELPAKVAARLMRGLPSSEREMTATILGYPQGAIGRRMSPEYVSLRSDTTAAQALEVVERRLDDAETVYTLPVLDGSRVLVGVVGLRELMSADPATVVADIMRDPYWVRATDDAEESARRCAELKLLALLVVDNETRLVGILTVDDALRILEVADSEDQARIGGTEPLRQPYLAAPIGQLVRSRVVWLLVLALGATLTVQVLEVFESTLDEVVTLALFVPLLIGTGGNTGNQAATTVTRALALDDVTPRDVGKVVAREFRVGLSLGVLLGTVAFVLTALVYDTQVGAVIGLTLVSVCTLAATVGGAMPLVARAIRADPAVFSNPFITTFVDATGLVVYFLIARAVLGL
ncbi:MAG: magnesium transporter [Rhodococcus sp.]|uniref:magnesium transporter n=1 Tax=Rhodococcus TaxID=1827 RepID=UPI0016AE6B85|nr:MULTISPECIES: magnesium transporter [Rhodococcus]NLV81155.1 magnesium transporter [Rhodococcus sp. (in: high G+C Gram-positive bacteria)]